MLSPSPAPTTYGDAGKLPLFSFTLNLYVVCFFVDFLDSCRANTLLAELDDEEDLPEPDDDDDENEDDNQEDQEYEEVLVQKRIISGFRLSAGERTGTSAVVSVLQEEEEYETKGGRRRTWDDDFVLKRQFSALVPAFDPRPGRTNVQQTTDLEIPTPGRTLYLMM